MNSSFLSADSEIGGCRVLRSGIGAFVWMEEVELGTRHHGVLAERVLIHQVLGDDDVERDTAIRVGHGRVADRLGRRRFPAADFLQGAVLRTATGHLSRGLSRSHFVTASVIKQFNQIINSHPRKFMLSKICFHVPKTAKKKNGLK